MRLFVAVRLPAPVVHGLDLALAPAREHQPRIRWVPAERWHLTLVFLGEVAPRELARVRRRVTRAVAAQPPLGLQLAGAGRFGDRVLWIGVEGDVAGLVALARQLSVDDRPYRPHLTVARGRPGVDLRPEVERLRQYDGPSWTATEVELIESHLGPRPTYETIETWPLNDSATG